MRISVVVGLLLLVWLGRVHAQVTPPAGPVRIAIQCESYGRTKACPAFLLGFVDANKVLLSAPRSAADVTLYASTTAVALTDMLHLRFVGTVIGAPKVIEIDVEIDTRGTDDAQRAQLEPAFLRGVALFVAARYPKAVTVTLAAPALEAVVAPSTTPWGIALDISGSGNAYGNPFKEDTRYLSFSGYSSIAVSRTERRSRFIAVVEGSGGISKSPPLLLDDGTEVSLDTRQWSTSVGTGGSYLMNDSWSFGGNARAFREDPKAQFHDGLSIKAGIEWDRYKADDPRGNRLAILYYGGYQVERYNIRNEIGERFAQFPTHGLIASGTVRKDKVGVGVSLAIGGAVIHPIRRHEISASPFIEWQIGGHVDINVSFSITKREFPAPDADFIDPSDYELLQRLSYAQPLSMNGSLSVSIHWDRTNGARNDRFNDL